MPVAISALMIIGVTRYRPLSHLIHDGSVKFFSEEPAALPAATLKRTVGVSQRRRRRCQKRTFSVIAYVSKRPAQQLLC